MEPEIHETLQHYFAALHSCDAEKFDLMWHPHGLLLGTGPDGAVVSRDAAAFREGAVNRGASPEYAQHDKILGVDMIGSRCATARVQIALPPAPTSPTPTTSVTLYTDFLTLLKDPAIGWRIIAKVYASQPLDERQAASKVVPSDLLEASEAVWGQYVAAGRAADGEAMAKVFHACCNLTFATDEKLVVMSSADFYRRVSERHSVEVHAPYAHLKEDPRSASGDTLVSLDFASSSVARCVLKIGYPPFLYTDVLLLLKLGDGAWQIVAKSSDNEPFMVDEAKPA